MSLFQALKRPSDYNSLSASSQWEIDKRLGILDWEPSEEENKKYQEVMNKNNGKK